MGVHPVFERGKRLIHVTTGTDHLVVFAPQLLHSSNLHN
jgi:hypothetical protein